MERQKGREKVKKEGFPCEVPFPSPGSKIGPFVVWEVKGTVCVLDEMGHGAEIMQELG